MENEFAGHSLYHANGDSPCSSTASAPFAKIDATRAINQALEAGWQGLDISEVVPLDQIARAHELVEHPVKPGRVIVAI